ncbi:hypothetical protein MIND_00106200 [Mycena indigotica]|uniref:DUF7918 domain-containing protein n=1 Tax=Mycena indigotica TaxID=2126181 RepID=A0A8H6TFU7_9AGAR|nr:uncharacterized protein MIND_00106200 [Mycena indigotica]KAF7315896.1 hypothetical protein MIND_00106200 [Mycena indigotica]
MQYNGFMAWVEIDGEEAKERPLKTALCGPRIPDEENLHMCFITSEAGKTFTVHWENRSHEPDTPICGCVSIDGQKGVPTLFDPADGVALPWTVCKDGVVGEDDAGNEVLRPFVFEQVSFTDRDDEWAEEGEDLSNLGVIEVDIYGVTISSNNSDSGSDCESGPETPQYRRRTVNERHELFPPAADSWWY